MNSKVLISSILVSTLIGCAQTPKATVAVAEPTAPPFDELIISYTPTNYGLSTNYTGKGATGLGGLAGLLGPLGAVAGILIDNAIEASIASESLSRTQQLDAKIKKEVTSWDVNRNQAELIAERLSKTTQLNIRVVAIPLQASGVSAADTPVPEKQARLELKALTGYGAYGASDSFKPVVVTEYEVRVGNPNRKVIQEKIITVGPKGEATFLTWDGLLSESHKIPDMADRQLQQHAEKISDKLQLAWKKSLQMNQAASSVTSATN